MRALAFAFGLIVFAAPAAATAQAQGCTAESAAACDNTKRETLADKFAPKADNMGSHVRKNARDNDKRERLEAEAQINEAIMAGRCDEAVQIARDAGYHGAVSQIKRNCKS